jgi:hypothetical protein
LGWKKWCIDLLPISQQTLTKPNNSPWSQFTTNPKK